MHLKIGLAAAVFAAVGTFAVAEGAGEGGCGDGGCYVGIDLHFGLNNPPIYAGHYEGTISGGNGWEFSGMGGRVIITGVNYRDGELRSVGNCSPHAGESSTSGEGGGSAGEGCNM